MIESAAARLAGTAPRGGLELVPRPGPVRATGRAVHFIDIENLAGTADLTIPEVQRAMRNYHGVVGIASGDHVIVAASHRNVVASSYAWPGARLLAQSGPDGADKALREAMRTERIAERFPLVFLGSGDGGFSDDLAFLASGGATTHAVSRRASFSSRLRVAAHRVTILPVLSIAA